MTLRRGEVSVGQVHEEVVVDNLSRTQIVQYAGASGDYNPIHTDEVYATEVTHFPSVFAHGMLTMGMTSRMLTDFVGVGQLTRFGGRFVAQVWPGDTLTARAEITELVTDEDGSVAIMSITTINQDSKEVFTGHATARVSD